MKTKEEILDFIKTLPSAKFDAPWEGDFFSTVLRHESGKWFGVILKAPESFFKRYGAEKDGEGAVLNLKCPPDLQAFLLSTNNGKILPAYHMNKKHWISVILGSGFPEEDLKKLITLSYEITGGKIKK